LGIGEPLGFLRPWVKLFRGERLGTATQGLTGAEIFSKLMGSVGIGALALVFALIWTTLLSTLAIARGRGRWAASLDIVAAFALGTPVFIASLLLAPVAAERGHYVPELAGAFAMSIWPGAFLSLLVSDTVRIELRREYVKTAQGKGLSYWRTWLKHVLPNVIPTLLDSLVPVTTALLAGSFAAERVLGLPYFGQLYVLAVLHRQLGVVVVATTLFATILAAVAIVVESVRTLADPRARDRLAQ
jgi:ABC-type dipeptide/oligopeptide/nickel transport system permease component